MRKAITILFIALATLASSQEINVSSFKVLESDLTANTTGTMEDDQNGETAALIKVVTTQQGFVFDGGMIGIVKTKQGVGEVWVYVPHGIKKITIQHPQLGVLRDYYFPIPIEKARTYEMVLTTGRVETVVTHSLNKQFVVFNVNPANAVVELNDEMLTVDSEGNATKGVPYGTYNYRVSCANYHTEAGRVTVTADGKAEVNVTLRPNFGWIKLDGAEDLRGAYVYIDNARVGQLPFVSENIKSGEHRVKIVKNMYKPYEQPIVVEDNETSELNIEMIPNFAVVTLTADAESEIWIDGEHRGKGRWNGRLEVGDYIVEVKKESHREASQVLHINTTGEKSFELQLPIPIYAPLEISSTPLRATVYIDGIEVGETPLIKSDILVGRHRVKFEKEGYGSVEQTVVLKEGLENQISVELSNVKEVNITSVPSDASVSIDGVYKGVTPLKTKLNYGEHTITFSKSGYTQENKTISVDALTNTINHNFSVQKEEITITSNPSKATVSIDNLYEGVTPLKVTLDRGSYLIYLSKKGYSSHGEYKTIPTTRKNDFHFILSKLEDPVKTKTKSKTDNRLFSASIGLNAGYSPYGFSYGGDWGLLFHCISVSCGVKAYAMGKYTTLDRYSGSIEVNPSVHLLRFNTQLGYTFQFGNLGITPQVGMVYGPSVLSGRAYVMGGIPYQDNQVNLVNKDYTKMNRNIMQFAKMRYGVVVGSRFEYMFGKSQLGLSATPEYVFSEGFSVNGGVVVKSHKVSNSTTQPYKKKIAYNASHQYGLSGETYMGYCPMGVEYGALLEFCPGGFYWDFSFGRTLSDCTCFGSKLGWAFTCGNRFLIIPQIGISGHDGKENSGIEGVVLPFGLRTLFCFSEWFALSSSTEYDFGQFATRLGITFNLGWD